MRFFMVMAGLLVVAEVRAWSNHAILAWPQLRDTPQLVELQVAAEPLSSFVEAEAAEIVVALEQSEQWAQSYLPAYAPTPSALRPTVSGLQEDPLGAFLGAIRVNPQLDYPLFVQLLPPVDQSSMATLGWNDLSFLEAGTSHTDVRYRPLDAGQAVSAADVFATASDEPDHGMDIGLFTDNHTPFGERYAFGEQPFGNPNLPYGSQAPFHMGFFHLDWLTRKAQPGLLATYPLWRIDLYQRLAEVAFETQHPYWGWRFMGWAMHYIGDLTQPYHAVPLPGVSTFDALLLVARGKTGEAVQLVSNRHGVLESYQWARVDQLMKAQAWQAPLLQAISVAETSASLTVDDVAGDVTAASVAAASSLDAALERYMPQQWISDPTFEWTGSGLEERVVADVIAQGGTESAAALDDVITQQLHRFADALKRWVNTGLALQVTSS